MGERTRQDSERQEVEGRDLEDPWNGTRHIRETWETLRQVPDRDMTTQPDPTIGPVPFVARYRCKCSETEHGKEAERQRRRGEYRVLV